MNLSLFVAAAASLDCAVAAPFSGGVDPGDAREGGRLTARLCVAALRAKDIDRLRSGGRPGACAGRDRVQVCEERS